MTLRQLKIDRDTNFHLKAVGWGFYPAEGGGGGAAERGAGDGGGGGEAPDPDARKPSAGGCRKQGSLSKSK